MVGRKQINGGRGSLVPVCFCDGSLEAQAIIWPGSSAWPYGRLSHVVVDLAGSSCGRNWGQVNGRPGFDTKSLLLLGNQYSCKTKSRQKYKKDRVDYNSVIKIQRSLFIKEFLIHPRQGKNNVQHMIESLRLS